MQRILLTSLFILFLLPLEAQQIAYLLADNVNVRSAPNTSASVVARLPIGTELETQGATGSLKIKGQELPWVKVAFEQDGRQMLGYLWQGFISTGREELVDGAYLVWGVEKVEDKEGWTEVYYQYRVYQNGKELSKVTVSDAGGLDAYRDIKVFDGKGVPGVANVIEENYSAQYCAGAMGDVVLFWDGETLFHARTLYDGADAPYWSDETFIYPADSTELGTHLVLLSQSGDGEEETVETSTSRYRWTGTKLVGVKK